MSFLHPAYLWGLLGLAIPVAIHLLSRKEGKVIRVGSLRHIEESNTSQFKSIRLNEILLLLLRLLMIIVLVLFLSGTRCTNVSIGKPTGWVVIENGAGQEPLAKPLIDSLTANGYEPRALAPGFPLYPGQQSAGGPQDYWALTQQLANEGHRDIVVVAFNRASSFRGKRPPLPDHIRWIAVEQSEPSARFPIAAVRTGNDSLRLQIAETTPLATAYTVSLVNHPASDNWVTAASNDSVTVQQPVSITVNINAAKGFETDREIIAGALNVIREESGVDIRTTTDSNGEADWRIILEPGNIADGKNIIYYSPGQDQPLLLADGSGRYRITRRLTTEVALKERLAFSLGDILLPKAHATDARDRRVLDDQMAWAHAAPSKQEAGIASMDISRFLLVALLFLWMLERGFALYRNQ